MSRCTNARARVDGAHDGFGIALCTTIACILSITAISWGNWSQTDMLISEEENVATYSGSKLSVTGSEEVWGEVGGARLAISAAALTVSAILS